MQIGVFLFGNADMSDAGLGGAESQERRYGQADFVRQYDDDVVRWGRGLEGADHVIPTLKARAPVIESASPDRIDLSGAASSAIEGHRA